MIVKAMRRGYPKSYPGIRLSFLIDVYVLLPIQTSMAQLQWSSSLYAHSAVLCHQNDQQTQQIIGIIAAICKQQILHGGGK